MSQESDEFHKEEDIAEKRDEPYIDWLTDNQDELKRNYLELHEDDFSEYCRRN